ncbi:ParB/RepB/Spo0J family partition protein [Streptomyces sp. GC420]|uniref:ParB/RepB/Spo0J family partition protein n=1 Tax=Streptomyces sp. GC420 TaxID=2697568 RepID=UPI001414D774|nr:ParB/RepB/Spo0J family partition protein [Streptomyces sp. GC420]NBM14379.1 ParB N-terminal domain-containing protein [Streptomyces sp. GC420]
MAQSNAQAVSITSAFSHARVEGVDSSPRSEFDPRNFERLPAREVPIAALSPGVSLRQGGTDAAHIRLLIDAADSAELPPILVQVDGCRVIDGLHRLEAARLMGDDSIRARFLDCSNSEALVIAMQANGSHGLPLSKADRVVGAQRVLGSHPDWSDRAIAGITGLSAKTIASLRDRSAGGTSLGGKRIGQDGRRRPVDAGEGRRRAAEYIATHPDAPLRQVARETDVSLGTVHDVSARLRRGEGPERNGRRTHAARPQHVRPVQSVQSVSVRPADGATAADVVADDGHRVPLRVAPSADAAPARRRNHTETPPTWAAVAAKMAADPAVRYTADGREFLRWMQVHAAGPGEDWRRLVDAVPPHWLGVIAPIAEHVGREWSLLAERLKARQETCRDPSGSRP